MKHLCALLPMVVTLLLLSCSPGDDLAGRSKGGSETTNGITACIKHSDGTPAVSSIVRLRRADFVSTPARLSKSTLNSAEIVTDPQGRFDIRDIDPGSYFIEVNDTVREAGRGGVVLLSSVLDSAGINDIGINFLKPYAALTGHIDIERREGQELFVQIRGLERLAMVNDSGTFSFTDLPEATLDIRIVEGGGGTIVERASEIVTTIAGDSVTVNVESPFTDSGYVIIKTSSAGIPQTQIITGFPLLVRLDETSFDFSSALADGADIQFTKADETVLPFEIEQWDAASKKAAIWVKIDSIYGSMAEQRIIMKWGDSTAQRGSGKGVVFDTSSGFVGVWHLNEKPQSGAASIKDHTGNGFHGIPNGFSSGSNSVDGMIGKALWFNGNDDHIRAGQCNVTKNYSLSCWVHADDLTESARRFIWKEYSFTLWYDAQCKGVRVEHFTIRDSVVVWRGIYQDNSRHISLDTSVWYYLTGTYDGDKIRLYINGTLADSTASIGASPILSSQSLSIGGRKGEYVKGIMDEVRVENRTRSPEWIRLCYLNQKKSNPLVTFVRQGRTP